MLEIKPFAYTEAEYRRMAEIEAAVFNMPSLSLADYRHEDESRRPDYLFQRDWIARDGGRIAFVDWGQKPSAFHPQKLDLRIWVDPAHDAADIRPFFLDYLLNQTRDRDLIALTSGMQESCAQAMAFFEAYDFQEVARDALSKLDLTSWDAATFADILAAVRAQGIEIRSLRDLQQADPGGWQRQLYDLDITISRDIPTTGEKHAHTFDSWRRARAEGPAFDPDAWFVALDQARPDGAYYVGQSQGYMNADTPDWFENGVTGVRREYRRRGLATALKVHLLRHAQSRGARSIATSNDARNPMYQLNVKLGFQPEPAWVRVEKTL